MSTKNSNYLEGIYFSKITGRIFEATKQVDGFFLVKFVDSNEIKNLDEKKFHAQVEWFEFYEILIDYNDPSFR